MDPEIKEMIKAGKIKYSDLSGPMKFAAVGGFVNMLVLTVYAILFLIGFAWGVISVL